MPALPRATICAKSNGGILKIFGWSEYGCYKINTLFDETECSFPESTQAFPSILDLAQLSQHAYKISNFKDDKEIPFKMEHMPDWICIGTGRYRDGYCGAAYANKKYSHVVIAHGGTEFNLKKLNELYRDFIITDVGGVFLNKEVSQISSAYIFTKIIVNLYSDTQFSISITGHSLGGWLAQLSAFYIAHPNYISQNKEVQKIIEDKQSRLGIREYVDINAPCHVHTVSFDSPGCRQALRKIVGYYGSKAIEWRKNVDTLDFTVVIAPSNSVNACGEHVGHVLELEMKGITPVSWISESHGIQNFVDHLSIPVPKLKEVHNVYWWKPVQSEDASVILDEWYIGRQSSCPVNIFSPKELEILMRIQMIFKWRNNESLQSSWCQIFGDEKHKGALTVLNSLEEESLNDFIQNFNVTHNVIEFPKKCLEAYQLDMSELIWKLIRWFRLKRVWLSGYVFQNVIRDLPGCREMFCESQGSLYIDKIPKLHSRECTTKKLCDKVRMFLGNRLEHFVPINAGSDGRQSRLYMTHLYNCFGKNSEYYLGERVLFINTSTVQRLHREIDMANIFSQTKFRLIVVECDSEINEEMNKVTTGMIENAIFEKKKLIIVTNGDNCSGVENYTPLECDVDLTLEFTNLDESTKKDISQCHVEMHGYTLVLGKTSPSCGQYLLEDVGSYFNSCNSSDIICDIYDEKIIDLSGGSLPVMAQHYIPRTLFQITLDVERLIRKVEDFSDIIVISNSKTSIGVLFPELIPLFCNYIIYEPKVSEYSKVSFLNDCASKFMSRNVHWFKHVMENKKSMLVWQMSNGQPCFDYLVEDKGEIPDSKLHELQNNFIILADEPGMGKSAAITKLFLEYKNIQFNSKNSHFNWPVYINLNHYQVELRNTVYTPDSAINFLTQASNLECEFEKSLFRFSLEEIGNVTFFIDSFDEISPKGQEFVVQMLKHLKGMTQSKIRVWMATRNYAKYELEQRLGTKSYRFHRVEEEAQINFLVNSWTHNVPLEHIANHTISEKLAEIFAKRAITEIRKVLGTDQTFIGIPLQLVLLALIYNDKFLQLLDKNLRHGVEVNELSISKSDWENCSAKFSTTLELYDLFVNKKMNIWLEDKFKFDTRSDWMEETLKTRMNEIHSQAAFLYLSTSILTKSEINIESLSPADSYEVNRVGFCERIVGWGKTLSMPQNVFECIRKSNNDKGEQSCDIVFLTLDNSFPDRTRSINTKGILNAEIKYGTEGDLSVLMNFNYSQISPRLIHYFKEVTGSKLAWEYSSHILPETSSTEFVEIEITQSNFRFYHQTIAEYFTAKYLVNLIRKDQIYRNQVVSFLTTHYHKPYFKKIRYFLDSLLCVDISVLENIELLDTKGDSIQDQSLRQCFTNRIWGGVDALERNILHYAMAYGNHDNGIFWMIAKNLSLFHRKDLLGETCLSYLCLSENFPHWFLPDFPEYLRNEVENMRAYGTEEEKLIARIIDVPVLYSIFCGSEFDVWLTKCIQESSRKKRKSDWNGEYVIPKIEFEGFMKTTSKQLLIENVTINVEWLIHSTIDSSIVLDLFKRLCLHNSLDEGSEISYLNDWLITFLSDEGQRNYELGAQLIHASLGIQKWSEYVLTILKNNLPKYYHNVYPYITSTDQNSLWNSCTDIEDKRKMLSVMKNYNFYFFMSPYSFKEEIQFIYTDPGVEDFKDAMIEALVKVFRLFLCADILSGAYLVYHISDDTTKTKMINENFESTMNDERKLNVESTETFRDIRDGKNDAWTLRELPKINSSQFQSHFFTLPVPANYPNDQ